MSTTENIPDALVDIPPMTVMVLPNGVSFVSVTQQFNTTNSMGRLTLNILLSFAQFEREIISERTRDKIAAARHNDDLHKLVGQVSRNSNAADRITDVQERIRGAERRATNVREELIALGRELVDEKEAVRALALFDPVWDALSLCAQVRVMQLLVLCLAPDIQRAILFLPLTQRGRDTIRELMVWPIAAILDWRKQRRLWKGLKFDQQIGRVAEDA